MIKKSRSRRLFWELVLASVLLGLLLLASF